MDDAIRKDDVMRQILDSDSGATMEAQDELLMASGGKAVIAGREFPAPTAAVLALLEVIKSPFVSENANSIEPLDVFRALYLLANREKAAFEVLKINREKTALEKFPETKDPAMMMIQNEQRRLIAAAEARFDEEVLNYADKWGCFNPALAARELGAYLALASGWKMLPDNSDESKKKD